MMLSFIQILSLSLLFSGLAPAFPLVDGDTGLSFIEDADNSPANPLNKRQEDWPFATPNYQGTCQSHGVTYGSGASKCNGAASYSVACDSSDNANSEAEGTCDGDYFCEDANPDGKVLENSVSTSARCVRQDYIALVTAPKGGSSTSPFYCIGKEKNSFHARMDSDNALGKQGALNFAISMDGGDNWYQAGSKPISGDSDTESFQISFDSPNGEYICYRGEVQASGEAFDAVLRVVIAPMDA